MVPMKNSLNQMGSTKPSITLNLGVRTLRKKKQTPVKTRESRLDLYKRSTFRKRNEKPKDALSTTFRLIKYLRRELILVIIVVLLLVFFTATTLGSSYFYRN